MNTRTATTVAIALTTIAVVLTLALTALSGAKDMVNAHHDRLEQVMNDATH